LHGPELIHRDGNAAALHDDDFPDVVLPADPAEAAHQVLGAVLVEDLAADARIGGPDRAEDLAQADVVGPEFQRIDVDLVLADKAPTLPTSATPGTLLSW